METPLNFSLALLPGVLGSMFPEDGHRVLSEAGQNSYKVFLIKFLGDISATKAETLVLE